MMRTIKKNFLSGLWRPALLAVLTAGLSWLWWEHCARGIRTNLYFERDFWRAVALAKGGSWPAVGPELSGGGRGFGPFFYYLLALPNLRGPNLVATIHFLQALLVVAGAGTAIVLARYFGAMAGLFFLFAFHGSHLLVSEFERLWNPVYSAAFALAGLLLLWHRSLAATFAAGFLIGAAAQIHGAMVFLVPGLVAGLYGRDRCVRSGLILGAGFLTAWLAFRLPSWFMATGGASMGGMGALELFLLRLRWYSPELWRGGDTLLAGAARFAYVAAIPAGLLFYVPGWARRADPLARALPWRMALLTTFPLAWPYVVEGGVARYAIPFSLVLMLLSAVAFERTLAEWAPRTRSLAAIGVLFALAALGLSARSKYDRSDRFYRLTLEETKKICRLARAEGLAADESLRFRLYGVGVDLDSFTPSFCMFGAASPARRGLLLLAPDYDFEGFLPEEFAREVARGKIRLNELGALSPGGPRIFSYEFSRSARYPAGIANVGVGYANVLQGREVDPVLSHHLPPQAPLFEGALTGQGGRLRIWRDADHWDVFLELEGAEVTAPSINEGTSHFYRNAEIRYTCEGGVAGAMPLATMIGTRPRFSLRPDQIVAAKTRLPSPLRLRFPAPCRRPKSFSLAYDERFENWLDIRFRAFPAGQVEFRSR